MGPHHAPLRAPGAADPSQTPRFATLRIGEAARQVGVSASALRLWERQQLVTPARTASGYRLYSEDDVAHLRRIRRMRDQQVNAPGIRRMLPLPWARAATPARDGALVSRLRAHRRRLGLSLKEAGGRARISPSFLSALERGAADASLATMQRLTRAYGVTMLDLFEPAAGVGRRVRPAERPVLDLEAAGIRIEQLAVGAAALEPQLFVLAPGSSSEGRYSHAGEEFLYVLEGDVTFWVGAREVYRLRTGDSLSFPSTLPHRWRNAASGETRLLWINTPPTF
ncbi:MAG TPA: MerR family transcriptional regulator [Candidatus Limnocylindria bacterium]|nr:MerR family transcriptional regulator [Candidatus Limnocylindria bacterium]